MYIISYTIYIYIFHDSLTLSIGAAILIPVQDPQRDNKPQRYFLNSNVTPLALSGTAGESVDVVEVGYKPLLILVFNVAIVFSNLLLTLHIGHSIIHKHWDSSNITLFPNVLVSRRNRVLQVSVTGDPAFLLYGECNESIPT